MSQEMRNLLAEALRRATSLAAALTPEQYEEMLWAQRESFVRAMGPCEHGVKNWETCAECKNSTKDDRSVE